MIRSENSDIDMVRFLMLGRGEGLRHASITAVTMARPSWPFHPTNSCGDEGENPHSSADGRSPFNGASSVGLMLEEGDGRGDIGVEDQLEVIDRSIRD